VLEENRISIKNTQQSIQVLCLEEELILKNTAVLKEFQLSS